MDLANVRIREHFGLISNDTSTVQFHFLVSPPKNRETIEKQDIICINHPVYGEAGLVLAEVKEISSYEEVAGSTIGDRIGKRLAAAQIIGYFDLRNEVLPLQKLLVPPNAGGRVYMPYASFLEDVFSRGTDGKVCAQPIYLGKAEIYGAAPQANDQQIICYLNGLDLASKHTLISAIDGAGKTYTATVLIEELANKTSHPIVVLDPNNEYSTINNASTSDKNYPFSFKTATINADAANNDAVLKKIKENQVTIITAENFTLTEKSEFYANILNALTKNRREKTVQPFLLVIEDAENLPPQAIQEIIGSKNGIATVLITSHPIVLGGKVLSKMALQIVGRTNDPEDLAFLKNIIGGGSELLSSLEASKWIINGLNIVRPMTVQVRERYSKPK